MSEIISLFQWMCFGFVFFAALFLILKHLPNSPLRTIALRASAGLFAVLVIPVYVILSIDLIPEAVFSSIGLIDDAAVVILGILAGRYALKGFTPC